MSVSLNYPIEARSMDSCQGYCSHQIVLSQTRTQSPWMMAINGVRDIDNFSKCQLL